MADDNEMDLEHILRVLDSISIKTLRRAHVLLMASRSDLFPAAERKKVTNCFKKS